MKDDGKFSNGPTMCCDCGGNLFYRFGPYPQSSEPDKGLGLIFTCTACGDQLRVYQATKMGKMRDDSTKRTNCPSCHHLLEAATSVHGNHPARPGDFTLCMYCAACLIFTEDLDVKPATAETLRSLPLDLLLQLRTAQHAILVYIARRN